ncbi:ester cyclase [Roseibacterium sp. SDUM158017]|uniref:nuclear transport factor 2 family protein n=1 Tax=Roseicyclus salinarum TaxID=3036773 RepID=UPI002414E8AE|nr:ester cyclase [Roseibacterium sp. SDUM158017]MDG4649675.1 ester cyclase [Roseibacterium sp. SDUM158017]
MTEFQAEKALVRAHHAALAAATPRTAAAALAEHTAPDWQWRGICPFDERRGADEVADVFWTPLLTAMTALQRREDIFFAGRNEIDGFRGTWVVSMGHLAGLFDASWLGIRPTRKLAMLRYAEFHRVEDGRIAETAQFADIPHLMTQAGQSPFGPATAQHMVQPGPRTHDGLLLGPQPRTEGEATLAAIDAMISDLGTWQSGLPLEDELRRTWAEDMLWWGPEGIGATYTIPRYAAQHSGPFRAAFTDRSRTGHVARLAEGHYGGFFGWPNFTARHAGGFMGLPAGDRPAEFRVVDIYRREGDRLAENWVFIDMLHVMRSQGVDVLGRMRAISGA